MKTFVDHLVRDERIDPYPLETNSKVVPTFESLSIYWRPTLLTPPNECPVGYCAKGSAKWRRALPLWFDARIGECRGSIAHLRSGTEYEVHLTVDKGADDAQILAGTWPETFPEAGTIHLPENSDNALEIDQSGSQEGYVVFTAFSGRTATIDVNGRKDHNIIVSASHIIIRGLILKNARRDAILLQPGVHDVVIEDNDISGWGRTHTDGWGVNSDAAISTHERRETEQARIIIQRNKIRHPRSDANAWDEFRKDYNTSHPLGPQAVFLWNTRGNHVIRFNEIYSDDEHKFNDCIGGGVKILVQRDSRIATATYMETELVIVGTMLSNQKAPTLMSVFGEIISTIPS